MRRIPLALALCTLARAAAADQPAGEVVPDPRPPLALLPPSEEALMDPALRYSWGTLPARWFLATTVDVGFVYARPRLQLGYGKPFTYWAGLDAATGVTRNGLGVYGGARAQLFWLELRAGARRFWAFEHRYLPRKRAYERLELETSTGPLARAFTLESELEAWLPLGPGVVPLVGSVFYVTGVPERARVFEETLHLVVEPPWALRLRSGYLLRFGARAQHAIGLVAEVLASPERDAERTWRAGPLIRLVLSRRVEVRGSFVATLASPDRIGLVGGDFTELGVRYRWATE